ncbi:alginate export family protein [Wenyingzhuangia sp. 1_MG-2023]|nr:alginate export family protein [Wenyingzhuangia sp. 1_MG-2023]
MSTLRTKIFSLTFIFFISCLGTSYSQTETFLNNPSDLDIDMEYRPRTEYRRGYRTLPNNESDAAFFTSHRARINVNYSYNDQFLIHTTLQDIRIWGDTDTRDANGKAQFYEFYVEPKITDKLSVRVGRQRIKYDNQRLFAENNWRQAGGQHDAVRFMYRNDKLEADLITAYNQNDTSEFGTDYDVDWDFYRGMVSNFVKYQATDKLTFTSINIADEYTDPTSENTKGHWKFTNGGRLEFQNNDLTFNLASYYQWGHIENGKQHNAYYLEPEIKWDANSIYTLRIGAQIFSGDKNSNDNKSNAFLTQYGAFHRHNGGMDYTQKTVRTYEHEGILNPYIFQDISLNNKLRLNWQSHLFGATTPLTKVENGATEDLNRIYAWENDFRFFYQPNHYTTLEMAYLFLIPDESMSVIPTGKDGNTSQIAQFAYISINWTPKILNIHR